MTEYPFTTQDLKTLKNWDTPTICNGLEVIVPERRAVGFTVEPMVRGSQVQADVGIARTGMIRAKEPPRGPIPPRDDWYGYVAEDLPTIAVLQDIDDRPGYGAFWGEVQTTVHKGLGSSAASPTARSATSTCSPGFQIVGGRIGPSHAHIHLVPMNCQVNMFGMLAAMATSSTPISTARSSFRRRRASCPRRST